MIDLLIEKTSTKGYALDPFTYKLVYDCGYKEEEAVIKQRELKQAQVAVANVMKRIREIREIYPDNHVWNKKDIIEELHRILRGTMV